MRGYLLAGQEEFLAPYTDGNKKFLKVVAEVSGSVQDNPAQVQLLREVKDTIAEWQKKVTEPTIQLRRNIGDAKNMDNMADLVGEARGKVYFDKFRQVMGDFRSEEAVLMKQRQVANVETVENTKSLIIYLIIGATIAGVVLGFYL